MVNVFLIRDKHGNPYSDAKSSKAFVYRSKLHAKQDLAKLPTGYYLWNATTKKKESTD